MMDNAKWKFSGSSTGEKSRISSIFHGLFGSVTNTIITLIIVSILVAVARPFFDWVYLNSVWLPADSGKCLNSSGACWAFVQLKFRTIIFGRYPYEEQWRPLLAMILLVAAVVVSADWRQWRRRNWLKILVALWVVVLIMDGMLMTGGLLGLNYVTPDRWSGLPLTLILAVFGITLAFIAGIFLALGRVSNMPIIRWFCIGYIELVRGVPLITMLFMAVIMLPILLPADFVIYKILKAQLAFAIFFSAYLAEVIRGGLQSLPKGQYEAANALGLSYGQTMRRIILPQALRITIPSTVNTFINAFKDTSLVIIISMLDLLGTTMAVIKDPAWFGIFIEAYIFTAMVYFIFCAVMSWYSQRLERYLGRNREAR